MNQPQTPEYPRWAEKYISLVGDNVITTLAAQATDFPNFMRGLQAKADYAYAPGKWTIKELLGHMIDTERVLVYRLMCIARGEKASLPGFDEDNYVAHAHFSQSELADLAEEFGLLRKANLFLIKSLNKEELNRKGVANDLEISVRAIVFVLAGHVIHHQKIIEERYL
ncbi:DinB family protein [Nubsella zeaxanthinifaciens]|uniref:DinB family protein n=1 Tax=Nubsella zeaxanthinifaciens TaxID=392412 RepID=UPI003CFFAB4E